VLTFVDAVVLAVAHHALTRDQDRDLALALCCRNGEGVTRAISAVFTLGLLSVASLDLIGSRGKDNPGSALVQ